MCELLSVVDRFNAELNRITPEKRDEIRHITKVAYDFAPFAVCIMKSIINFTRKLFVDKKLIGIYMMDSSIKCPHEVVSEYRRLFDKELVNLISETFQQMNFELRLSLYACRRTWKSIFSDSTLERLNRHINAIDPAWPQQFLPRERCSVLLVVLF
uniref:CID domain-containing protein n=1 Tax=Panagrellus redivivus TaxID=6233 RepID=A0A7E4ZYZ1_PANRE